MIGAGFSGIAAASVLAKQGYEVTVLEKNDMAGGRARKFSIEGFTFDMGPSWYWMPDVFETFFSLFGKRVDQMYNLVRLNPSYKVFFGENDFMELPAEMAELESMFERYEPGSAASLRKFLTEAAYKYKVGMKEFVYKPSLNIFEFIDLRILKSFFRLQMYRSISGHIRKLFKHKQLISLLEFPVLFLGAKPQDTPAMYSLMNYADLVLGTWYPMGGMYKIVEAMVQVAEDAGVGFVYNQDVKEITIEQGAAVKIRTQNKSYDCDLIVAGADYRHIEMEVLDLKDASYSEEYWDSRTLAPSSLIFYLGLNKKVERLRHHNLFFDENFETHAEEIYDRPQWPSKPLFYVSVPSVTDPSVAPDGCENVFILIPVAPALTDTEETREKYFAMVMERLERLTGQNIRDSVIFKRSYAHRDFVADYHAFKGNAYGLANTLRQTAFLKPQIKSKKINNLYYTGQLTTPGPGVPPSIISGQVVANLIIKENGSAL